MHHADSVSLDHAGFMVRDLDRGAHQWEKLGFQLSPRSPQIGYVPGEDTMQPWATSNHCAMFEQGYLELIGVTEPEKFNPWAQFINRFEGPHITAFRCEAADRAFALLCDRIKGFDPPLQRQRNVSFDGAIHQFKFRNIFSQDKHFPEGRFIIIEHQTPEVIWRRELMNHPNGARALTALIYCTETPNDTLERLTAITGEATVANARGEPTIPLRAGGALIVLDHKAYKERYQTAPKIFGPHVAAAIVQVENIDRATALLKTNGVSMQPTVDGGIWIAPQHTNGGILQFKQASGQSQT